MDALAFAHKLAGNEKTQRDRALRALRRYLAARSVPEKEGFSDKDLIKIWKGLYYCMYMADKPLIQEELAEGISELIHNFGHRKDCQRFIKQGFLTLAREWNNMDIFRLDKFMMLVRRFLRQIFVHLHLTEYYHKEVKDIADILDTTVVAGGDQVHAIPLGLKLHVTKIFLEELAKIGGEDLPPDVISTLLKPFMKAMILSEDKRYVKAIQDQIFNDLMRQSDVGLEYQMALEGDGEDEDEEGEEDEDEDDDDEDEDDEDEDLEIDDEDEDLEIDDEDLELDEEDEDLDEEFDEDDDDDFDEDDETGYDSELEEEAEEEEEIESEKKIGIEKETEKNNEKEESELEKDNGEKESSEEKGKENEKKDESQLETGEGNASKNKEEEGNNDEEEDEADDLEEEEEGDDDDDDEEEEEEEEDSDEEIALDPRAGGVDVSLPQLNPDFSDLAEQLRNLAKLGRLKPGNRKIAKKVVQQLMDVTKDRYPLARKAPAKIDKEHLKLDVQGALYRLEKSLPNDNLDLKGKKEKEKAERKKERRRYKKQVREEALLAKSLKYEGKERTAKEYRERKQKILRDLKQMKEKRNIGISTKLNLPTSLPQTPFHEASLLMKEKKSKSKKLEANQVTKESNSNKTNKKRKGQLEPAPPKRMAFEVTNITKPAKKLAPKIKNSFEITDLSTSVPTKRPAENIVITSIPNKKKKTEATVGNREHKMSNGEMKASKAHKEKGMPKISNGKIEAPKIPKEKGTTTKMKKGQESVASQDQMPLQNGTTAKKLKAVENQKDGKQNGLSKASKKAKQGKNKGDMKSRSVQNGDTPATKASGKGKGSPWDEPMQKGEIEVFIKSRKQIEKEKQKSIKVAPKETLASQKEKSIRINLRQNKEHEFSDYARTLKNSPSIPFSADKLPKAPVLKPSPSPILVRKPPKRLLKVVAKTASPSLRRTKAQDFF